MRTFKVEVISGTVVVSSSTVEAALPFKAAERHAQKPVTLRRKENEWIRVTELNGEHRMFAYTVRHSAQPSSS
ncbi:hypothetical protein [Mesorhizobium jarvisii]|uniref:hypothetical protein n=1 Tax=Mesorhizobium jarvisii TaxID=1777867 RepID=UPI000AB231AE|nr:MULTISPECIES: hypothetical protein [Mesorhizobium]